MRCRVHAVLQRRHLHLKVLGLVREAFGALAWGPKNPLKHCVKRWDKKNRKKHKEQPKKKQIRKLQASTAAICLAWEGCCAEAAGYFVGWAWAFLHFLVTSRDPLKNPGQVGAGRCMKPCKCSLLSWEGHLLGRVCCASTGKCGRKVAAHLKQGA